MARPDSRASYHHGDLANALTDAATELARNGGPGAVVLREAARQAGVSAAAAYRHFADHGDLLHAVRRKALEALGAAMRASLAADDPLPDPADEAMRRFRALGIAYLDFALADPGLFRTAFCRPARPAADPGALVDEQGPYGLLAGVLDELVQVGLMKPERRPLAEIASWAAMHGLATLLLDGPLALLTGEDRAIAVERTLQLVWDGLTA